MALKKTTTILLGIIYLFILTACHAIYVLDHEELVKNVIRIELVYYDRTDAREITDLFGNLHRRHLSFDFDRMKYLETLGEVQHETFFEEFSSIVIVNFMRHQNSANGMALLLYDENDYFIVFSAHYVGRFNPEGRFIEYLGEYDVISFRELIERHFDTNWSNLL